VRRVTAALPRCELPLSRTQKTRRAERYGSLVMTWLTSRPNGSMPVRGSQRPKSLARWTSQAARYWMAPPRSYSNSTRMARPTAGDSVGWQRIRAWMLVFSSALITNSSSFSGRPCHAPAYRSRTRPALGPKAGSRGKIQLRWVQGLIASSVSQRQIVVSLIEATSPRRITSERISGTCRRLKGRPRRAGSSHAIALTAMTSSGGKTRPAAGSRALGQPRQALLEEALPPLRHDLDRGVEPVGDLDILPILRGQEHDPSPNDIAIRC
jgi:hypothetical protein